MDSFYTIIITLIPVFGIMLIGAFAQKHKILPNDTIICLNQFVYWFGLPMLLFYLMATSRPEHISWRAVLGCGLALCLAQAVMTTLFLLLKRPWKDSLLAGVMISFPNVFFMGIPIILLIFPDSSQAKAMAALTALMPTVFFAFTDVALALCEKQGHNTSSLLKNLIKTFCTNPAIWSLCLGLFVMFSQISLPHSVLEITKMLGSTASPCALFCTGMVLYIQLSDWKYGINIDWIEQIIILFGKLLLLPLLAFIFGTACGIEGVGLATITILCAMPVGVSCHIIALKHKALVNGCANGILLSTVLSILTLPIIIFLFF